MQENKTRGVEKELKRLFLERLESEGLAMSKQLSSGGLFGNSVYDYRTVYKEEDLERLNNEGFSVDEDLGAFIFNMIASL